MFRNTFTVLACVAILATSLPASANTEPTAYDTRSIGLGLGGVSYLERPAAVAINPALLEGINKFSFSILVNPLFVFTQAPVSGANQNRSTGLALGPLGSIFAAGRIAPRVVMGVGIYIEQGYGATFSDVVNVDGAAGNTEGQDLSVVFFNGEVAIASSIRLHKKLSVGIALRLPFARQDADLWQNIGAPLGDVVYGRVKNKLGGVGFPSPRIGISYKPTNNFWLGAMWRAYSKLRISGSTNITEAPPVLGAIDLNGTFGATANWVIPNALQFGGAGWLVDRKLMLSLEGRLQFHGANKQGNVAQVVTVDTTSIIGSTTEAIAPFNWKTIWSLKVGAEYQVSKLVAIRGGFNAAVSNIREAYAQYFTPPPGFSPAYSVGVGFTWEHFELDIASLVSVQNTKIGPEITDSGALDLAGDAFCSAQQTVRTGCEGTYKTRSFWASVTFTYRL